MRRLLTTLTVLALLLAACGDDDDAAEDADSTSTEGEVYEVEGDEAASAGAGTAVAIGGFAFDPEAIEVGVGDTVTWTNEDGVAHTVTAGTPGSAADDFDEAVDAGERAEVTFDEAGTFEYFCEIHPAMTGQVVVS